MGDSLVVLKCRECGATRAIGYGCAEHSRLDGCDGQLDFYCNACRRFVPVEKCATCEHRAGEADKQQLRERKKRITKLLSMPGVSLAYACLRRWSWFERASEDFIERGGLARQQKKDVAVAAGVVVLGLCAPAWMRVVLWSSITLSVLLVLCCRTLSDDRPRDV